MTYDSIIKTNNQKLENLGFKLDTSELKLFSQKDWTIFSLSNFGDYKNGYFDPVDMIAYVPLDDDESLSHEHFGHRFYFEKSKLGKELRKLSFDIINSKGSPQEVINLENKLISLRNENNVLIESFANWMAYFLLEKDPREFSGYGENCFKYLVDLENKNGPLDVINRFL
ncbi:hypothetical protein KY334_08065 [Candidatus Woesearchaeota archaeon]|nr:hypothetical protein [Candidatus Woesearchaeota archaeon]